MEEVTASSRSAVTCEQCSDALVRDAVVVVAPTAAKVVRFAVAVMIAAVADSVVVVATAATGIVVVDVAVAVSVVVAAQQWLQADRARQRLLRTLCGHGQRRVVVCAVHATRRVRRIVSHADNTAGEQLRRRFASTTPRNGEENFRTLPARATHDVTLDQHSTRTSTSTCTRVY
jgi:hypothetical protein